MVLVSKINVQVIKHGLRNQFQFKCFTTTNLRLNLNKDNQKEVENTVKFSDVFVVGGGVAGLTFINLLGNKLKQESILPYQPKLTLVDRNILSKEYIPGSEYSNRVVSLTPNSIEILKQSEAYKFVKEDRVCPYKNILVEDSIGGSKLKFEVNNNEEEMAYSIEINNLTQALIKNIDFNDSTEPNLNKVEMLEQSEVLKIEEGEEGFINVQVKDNSTSQVTNYKTRLLVGADGIGSKVRLFKDISVMGWSYEQLGLVATLKTSSETSHLNLAYQRFLPTGTVAFLPLKDNRVSLVWSLPRQLAPKVKLLDKQLLIKLLNTTLNYEQVDISYLLDRVEKDELNLQDFELEFRNVNRNDNLYQIEDIVQGSLATFPLQLRHVSSYVEDRVALIGDAAHIIHPLAGQGMNLGIHDADSLAKNITKSVVNGYDLGDKLVLQEYAKDRYFKNLVMLGAVDKLHRIFRTDSELVAKVRSFGIDILNSKFVDPFKKYLVELVRKG